MNRRKLFGMNAKQCWFVVVFFPIDLLVLGLLVLTVIFGWDYTAALLSGIWQFVTVDIPRLIFAAVSAFFMIILGILWFLASIGGTPGRFPFPRSPFRRSYRFIKPSFSLPNQIRTSIRSPRFKPFRTRNHRSVETSTQLTEIKPPDMTSPRSVETSIPSPEINPYEIPSPSSIEASTQLPENERSEILDILIRIIGRLRLLKIEWPKIDLTLSSGSYTSYYGSTHVRSYFRRDGTYVRSHYRRGYTLRSRRW